MLLFKKATWLLNKFIFRGVLGFRIYLYYIIWNECWKAIWI